MKFPRSFSIAFLALLAAPLVEAEQFSVLLFTKAAGWHHDSINAGVTAVQELGRLHEFKVFWTEDPSRVFTDTELSKYQAVIFMLTTGDVLNEAQQAAFQAFIRRGGGFVGIYSASDTEPDWPWYTRMVGHHFRIHPEPQTAVLQVQDRNFPGMDRWPKRFLATEVWYEFEAPLSDKLHYLLTVDETTYNPAVKWAAKEGRGMGAFHPISWYQEYDGGRAFYTGLGHIAATFSDPAFRHHIFGGIYWAATGKGFKAD